MKRSPMPRRTKPLARVSARRLSEGYRRSKVKRAALARDGGCVAATLVLEVDCWGPLDAHEVRPRSLYPAGHLDLTNVVTVCRSHHDWVPANLAKASALGLHSGLVKPSGMLR